MAYLAVYDILDIRAVESIAFALRDAYGACVPVVVANERQNVNTFIAEELL